MSSNFSDADGQSAGVDVAIEYCHTRNAHSLEGAHRGLRGVLQFCRPSSLLDVGCGPGAWLRAALDLGIDDVFGVDGRVDPRADLRVPASLLRQHDLTQPLRLGRRFDLVLCLEVAEHLDESAAEVLVASLCAHADTIAFSAACPNQPGEHHVHCRWPAYWQSLFNSHGYACHDEVRWAIWDEPRIEPWYRQNLFLARHDQAMAGREARLRSVIHPDMLHYVIGSHFAEHADLIQSGAMPVGWYVRAPLQALRAKIGRRLHGQPRHAG